jgi:two-component system, OmpR family, response regulator
LCLDPNTTEANYKEQSLKLTPKEYRLLELFLRHGSRVLNRSEIMENLWSFEEPPEEDAVKALIKRLRQKLKGVGAVDDFIETVYGLGYRLKSSSQPDL